jgi:hypothetical protein
MLRKHCSCLRGQPFGECRRGRGGAVRGGSQNAARRGPKTPFRAPKNSPDAPSGKKVKNRKCLSSGGALGSSNPPIPSRVRRARPSFQAARCPARGRNPVGSHSHRVHHLTDPQSAPPSGTILAPQHASSSGDESGCASGRAVRPPLRGGLAPLMSAKDPGSRGGMGWAGTRKSHLVHVDM